MNAQTAILLPTTAAAALGGASASAAAPWRPAPAPLTTRWGTAVRPDAVWTEYPRPQMVRPEWFNLNGLWQFAAAGENDAPPIGRDLERSILVPFPMESSLSGIGEHHPRSWYRTTFRIPDTWEGSRILLHFDAVDWETRVYVNGAALGTHRGGYDGFSFDITDALVAGETQEVVLGVFDPTDQGSQPRGKQVLDPKGIFYTPTSGPWQTVWLEPVPESHVRTLRIVPEVDTECLRITATVQQARPGDRVRAVARSGDDIVGEAVADHDAEIVVPVKAPRLWSPSDPFLYDLEIALLRDDKPVDTVTSYFGMRKVEVAAVRGATRILLNGEELFQHGPLDQGFWPDGIYTAPSDDALRFDIEITRQLGFNMARKHVKIEPERWYAWCDRLGLLVWQDMPSANNETPESREQFETELGRMVDQRGNHPSIIMWIVFNEGWGQYDTERLTRWVKERDPSRLASNASGWTDKGVGDILDIHAYPGPGTVRPEASRAAVVGEYGGLGLPVDGHTWASSHWGYQHLQSPETLAWRYVNLVTEVWRMQHDEGLSAAVYTQTTDVETECNGLLTYDRAIIKMDRPMVEAVNAGRVPTHTDVVPTSEKIGASWRVVVEEPASGWEQPDFDDSSWRQAQAGFGTEETPGARVRTTWDTPDIWIRRTVELPPTLAERLFLRVHHDDDVEIYINGTPAAAATGYTTTYEYLPISGEGRNALRPGDNCIAAHCRQTKGGQYIDIGLVSLRRWP